MPQEPQPNPNATVHFEVPDPKGEIYCRWLDKRVVLNAEHFDKWCFGPCRYLAGSIQGQGVECRYDERQPHREG